MIKDKIEEILVRLINLTSDEKIQWIEDTKHFSYSAQKRAYERKMKCIAEDETIYELDIKYHLISEAWSLEDSPNLVIRNKNLPDGSFWVNGNRYKIVSQLRDTIKEVFCKDMNPTTQDIENILDSISKGINQTEFRDEVLEKVLDKK